MNATHVQHLKRRNVWRGLIVIAGMLLIYLFLFSPPFQFSGEKEFIVPEGANLSDISQSLKERHIIRSPALFEFFVILSGRERGAVAGPYHFSSPQPVFSIAGRISAGEYGVDSVRVTIPEGYTIEQIATVFSAVLPEFSAEEFISIAQTYEGYLFPDTYFFFPDAEAEDVFEKINNTFEEKMKELENEIDASPYILDQIITMASIVEREASGPDDAAIIAGILWNRFEDGELLQVDAPFVYLIGKGSEELTRSDLAIDSPYNTYRYPGLPPTPIGNPGLESIQATLRPEPTSYNFYLHGADGTPYYAETYQKHLENKRQYID